MRLPIPLVLIGVLIAGCTPAADRGPTTLVAQGSDQTSIVQWTEDDDGVLTGTYQRVSASTETDGPTTDTSNASIRGHLSKGLLNLTFDGGTTVTGTLSGDTMTLSVPQTDGGVRSVSFHRSTADAYNRAVEAIMARVSSDRSDKAQRAAEASAAAALAQEEQSLAKSAGKIPTLTSAVKTSAGELTTAVGQVRSALTAQRAALAAVKSSECIDVFTRIGDEGTAYGDLMTAAGDFETATADLAGVERDLTTEIASIQASVQSVQAQGGDVPDLANLTIAAKLLRQTSAAKTKATATVKNLTVSAAQVDAAANALVGRAC